VTPLCAGILSSEISRTTPYLARNAEETSQQSPEEAIEEASLGAS